jgi:transposase
VELNRLVQPKEGDPMEGIIPALRGSAKERLCRQLRKCRDSKLRTRYLVVINLANGRSAEHTAAAVQVSRSSVYRIAGRFREAGEAGLIDRREENGERKLDEQYLQTLYEIVASSPEQYGWPRPTWTRELLVHTLRALTGIRIHVTTMSRALGVLGARRDRPKPTVDCPWSKAAKNRRLREIRQLIDTLPDDEVAVYEDEVDIHLNPKIGLDWMVPGQQKQVRTPGQNQKRYRAGALDARTGELIWVEGPRKTSLLFLLLLWKLTQHYVKARVIHVVLDNYSIHSTQQVAVSLETEQGQRLRLHFLPPYCPDHNRIERVWEDLHANVTRNHTCRELPRLMRRVRDYLRRRNHRCRNATAA